MQGRDQGVHGVVDVRRVDQGGAGTEHGQTTRSCALDDPAHQLGVPRSPHDVRPHDDDPHAAGLVGREREQLGGGLGPRVVTARVLGVGRSGTRAGQGRARGARPTATRRARTASRPPRAPRRAPCAVPPTFTSSYSAIGPVIATFAARWITASRPRDGLGDRHGVGDGAEHVGRHARRAALQRADVVPVGDEPRGTARAEHPARAGDQDARHRLARSPGQHLLRPGGDAGAVDLRVVPDVGGQAGRDEDGGDARRRQRVPHGRGQRRDRRRGATGCSVSTTTTTCCVPRGPTPTTAAARTPSTACDPVLEADRA